MLYVLATAWRFFNQYSIGWAPTYFRFDTRLSGFFLGGLISISRITLSKRFGIIGIIGLPLLALQDSYNTNEGTTVNILAAELCAALIISSSINSGAVYSILSSAPFVAIGKLSYGIYLWHFPAMLWLRDKYSWETTLLLGASFSLAISFVIYRTIEVPIGNLRRQKYRAALPD
ncbi:hypothetical protein D9M69_580340 [compost metagenome]